MISPCPKYSPYLPPPIHPTFLLLKEICYFQRMTLSCGNVKLGFLLFPPHTPWWISFSLWNVVLMLSPCTSASLSLSLYLRSSFFPHYLTPLSPYSKLPPLSFPMFFCTATGGTKKPISHSVSVITGSALIDKLCKPEKAVNGELEQRFVTTTSDSSDSDTGRTGHICSLSHKPSLWFRVWTKARENGKATDTFIFTKGSGDS